MSEQPTLQKGQKVEIISRHIPAHMRLNKYDGSTGLLRGINVRRIAEVDVEAERPDGLCGKIYVPDYALRPVG